MMLRPRPLLAACCLLPLMNTHAADPLAVLRQSNAGLRRTVLDNGLVCLVKEERSAPVAAVQIWIGSGSIHEDAQLGGGLAHYLEHMAFKGTPTRGATEITKQIDDAGGEVNAYTTLDRTVFFCDLPSANWKVGVDVLADAVLNAALPEDEWEREKQVILREFAMGNDDPDRTLHKLLWGAAYRVHPYRHPVIGYEDVFRSMNRGDLLAFHRRHYQPDNIIAVVVGDVDAAAVEAHLRATLGSVPRKARAPVHIAAEPPQLGAREARRTGAYEVGRLCLAWHTVGLSHPDAPALDVLSHITGQGRSSRLVADLQEQQRLVYEVGAWSFTPKDPGLFAINAVFEPGREQAVREALEKQVADWQAGAFTATELAKAKRATLMNELGGLQTANGQASSYGSGEFYAGDPRFGETYLRRVEAVDAAALGDVARRYLTADNRTAVVLAPADADAEARPAQAASGIPAITRHSLSNGVPLLVREDHRLPFVTISAALNGGLLYEGADNNGITQLAGDLLTRGTPSRTAEHIAQAVEQLGASISPFTGRSSFGLTAQGLSTDAPQLMELLADCLLRPTFPEPEVEKQKEMQRAMIRQQAEQPMFRAQENLRALLYPDHPYRFSTLGTEESVARLDRAQLAALHGRLVTASNLVLSIFGDITPGDALALAESALAGMPRSAAPPAPGAARPTGLPARRDAREPREQAIVLMGWPGPGLKDPQYDAVQVIARALSGLSSDLGVEIREKRGLVYFVGASAQPALAGGHVALYAGTRAEAAAEVEQLMRTEAARVAREGLREEEWRRAIAQMKAQHDMGLQSNTELAQACALHELYGLGYEYVLGLPQRLDALTAQRLRDAAAGLFVPAQEAVSVVLPAADKEKQP
jgi:zinc protease